MMIWIERKRKYIRKQIFTDVVVVVVVEAVVVIIIEVIFAVVSST
jgi:hypothetical protein